MKHKRFERKIPYGDILIHSGDIIHKTVKYKGNDKGLSPKQLETYITMNNITSSKELAKYIPFEILEFNIWLKSMPHKYKIVIAGNHEIILNGLSPKFIQKYILTNCIYLQDSMVELYGLKIYGLLYIAHE